MVFDLVDREQFRQSIRRFGCILLAALVCSLSYADSDDEAPALSPELAEQGWVLLKKSGTEPSRFSLAEEDVIRIVAENSNALIYRRVPESDEQKTALSWQWQLREATDVTDLTKKRHDDRPVAIYAAFSVDRKYLGLWSRFKNSVLLPALGIPLRGKVLTYVWGGEGEQGDQHPNPYIADIGVMKILRNGHAPTERWFAEEVDLQADFEAAFGHPPKALTVIAISADSEDTQQRSEALVRALSLE